ncbi:MAG TPA: hypothetical protein VMN60_02735 [Longimicrobiales bacterium]|nr:hypothetical protein [Longimicrobiales bacterium]
MFEFLESEEAVARGLLHAFSTDLAGDTLAFFAGISNLGTDLRIMTSSFHFFRR